MGWFEDEREKECVAWWDCLSSAVTFRGVGVIQGKWVDGCGFGGD
jgi:hypothetical protein